MLLQANLAKKRILERVQNEQRNYHSNFDSHHISVASFFFHFFHFISSDLLRPTLHFFFFFFFFLAAPSSAACWKLSRLASYRSRSERRHSS